MIKRADMLISISLNYDISIKKTLEINISAADTVIYIIIKNLPYFGIVGFIKTTNFEYISLI